MNQTEQQNPTKIINPNLWKRCRRGLTDADYLKLLRSCFDKHTYIKYISDREIRNLLMDCFDIAITKDNIRGYINYSALEIEQMILNNNLQPHTI